MFRILIALSGSSGAQTMRVTFCMALGLMLAGGPWGAAAARGEPADWQADLMSKLMLQEKCVLAFLTDVKEFQKDLHAVVEARAHCEDGRSFDVKRRDLGLGFEVSACKPTVC